MNYQRLAEAVCFDLWWAGYYTSENMPEEAYNWACDARLKVHTLATLTGTDHAWQLHDAIENYCEHLSTLCV